MAYREYRVNVTTTGSAGSAAGTGDTIPLFGELISVHLDYHASAPATSDVTIAELGGAARTFLTRTNTATDGTFYPRVLLDDTAGADLTAVYGAFAVAGHALRVSIAQCDALTDAVVAYLIVREDR